MSRIRWTQGLRAPAIAASALFMLAISAMQPLAGTAAASVGGDALNQGEFRAVYHRTINGSVDNSKAHGDAKVTGQATTNGISYHGGPVMLGTNHVYVVWYGNWSGKTTTQSIINNVISNLGGSSYFNINTTYYNGSGTKISNSLTNAGSTTDNYSQGTSFGDSGVFNIVNSAITSGRLPKDTSGIYLVLTSSDVNETSGFLTQYCGWHTHGTISGSDIKYGFIGDPARNYSACSAQTVTPNGDQSGDAMVSVISHEIEEAATDPDLNAWYDTRGNENADKCAWTWGTTYTASNGSKYNITLGGKHYLIQQNWVNASGGYCSMSY